MSLWDRLRGEPSREEVAAEVRKRLARSSARSHHYDAEKYSIRFDDGLEVSLGNIYDEYRAADRSARRAVLDRFVASIGEFGDAAPLDLDSAREHLRPIVREKMFYEKLRLTRQLGKQPASVGQHRSLGAHLTVAVGIDRPSSIAEVGRDLLAEWKLDFDEALDLARKNLGRRSHANFEEIAPGVVQAPFNDEWDGSRAALPYLMGQLRVQGAPVALVLQRGVLLVTGSDDSRGLCALAAFGAKAHEIPCRMSAFPVQLEGDAWVDVELLGSHEAAGAFQALRYEWQARNYEEQRRLLAELNGESLFVTSFKVFRKPTGEIHSMASLTLDCDQLLPRTDTVSVVRVDSASSGEVLGILPWSQTAEILGSSLRRDPDCDPERFRVNVILTDDQVAEVRRRDRGQVQAAQHGGPPFT